MPIYEYACTACGERTETRQSFEDPPLTECLVCGGVLRKLYSPVGIVFKGSGFYSTDAKKKPGKAKDSKPAAETGSKGETKTEPKTGPKTDSKKDTPATTSAPATKTERSA